MNRATRREQLDAIHSVPETQEGLMLLMRMGEDLGSPLFYRGWLPFDNMEVADIKAYMGLEWLAREKLLEERPQLKPRTDEDQE